MALLFPGTWSELKHPYRRAELIEFLKDIELSGTSADDLDIDDIFHFLFDDVEFGAGSNAEIGFTLFDAAEAAAINRLCKLLDDLLQLLGDTGTVEYLHSTRWGEVGVAAKAALAELEKMGLPRVE